MSEVKKIADMLEKHLKHNFVTIKTSLSDVRKYRIMFSDKNSLCIIPTDETGTGIKECFEFYNDRNIDEIDLSKAELVSEKRSKEKREFKPEDLEKYHTVIGFDSKTFYHCKSYGEDKDSTFVCLKETEYPKARQAITNSCEYKGMNITEKGTVQAYTDGLKAVLKDKQLLIIFCSALSGIVNEFIGGATENMVIDISSVSNLDKKAIQDLTLSVFGEPDSLCEFLEDNKLKDRRYIPTVLEVDALDDRKCFKELALIIFEATRRCKKIKSPILICSDSEMSARAGYYEKVLVLNPKLSTSVRGMINSFTEENQSVLVGEIAKFLIDNKLFKSTLEKKLNDRVDSFIACYNSKYDTNYERGSEKKILETSGMILLCADILGGVLDTDLEIDGLQSELIDIIKNQIGEGLYEAFEDVKRIIREPKLTVVKANEGFNPKDIGKIGYKLDEGELSVFVSSDSLKEAKVNLVFDKRKGILKSNDCLRTSGGKYTYQDTKRGRYYYIKVPETFKDEILEELNRRTQETEGNRND